MKNYFKIIFYLLFGCCIMPKAFSQNDTLAKKLQSYFSLEVGNNYTSSHFKYQMNVGFGKAKNYKYLSLNAGAHIFYRTIFNTQEENGYFMTFRNDNYTTSFSQLGISLPFGLSVYSNKYNKGVTLNVLAEPHLIGLNYLNIDFADDNMNYYRTLNDTEIANIFSSVNAQQHDTKIILGNLFDFVTGFETGYTFSNGNNLLGLYAVIKMGLINTYKVNYFVPSVGYESVEKGKNSFVGLRFCYKY